MSTDLLVESEIYLTVELLPVVTPIPEYLHYIVDHIAVTADENLVRTQIRFPVDVVGNPAVKALFPSGPLLQGMLPADTGEIGGVQLGVVLVSPCSASVEQ